MSKIRKLLIVVLILALTGVTAFAADYTAASVKIEKMSGTVKVTNASGKEISVKNGSRLCQDYTVKTGTDGRVYVSLDASKSVLIESSSEVKIKQTDSKYALVVVTGTVTADVSSKLKNSESLDIHTTTMVTGIRGTVSEVTAEGETSTSNTLEGTTTVIIKNDQKQVFSVPGGSGITASERGTIPAAGTEQSSGVKMDGVVEQITGGLTVKDIQKETAEALLSGDISEENARASKENLGISTDSDELNHTLQEIQSAISDAQKEHQAAEEAAAAKLEEASSEKKIDPVFENQSLQTAPKSDSQTITLDQKGSSSGGSGSSDSGDGSDSGSSGSDGGTAETTFTVTLPSSGDYYTAAAVSSSPVTSGGSFSFTVTPKYTAGITLTVKANGTTLTAVSNTYTISNITEAQTVSVEGGMNESIDAAALNQMLIDTEENGTLTIPSGTTVTADAAVTVPAGKTLEFADGSALINESSIDVYGSLITDSGSETSNSSAGTITIYSGDSLHISNAFENEGSVITARSETETGLLKVEEIGSLTCGESGSITNNGTLEIAGSLSILQPVENNGSVTVSGTFENNSEETEFFRGGNDETGGASGTVAVMIDTCLVRTKNLDDVWPGTAYAFGEEADAEGWYKLEKTYQITFEFCDSVTDSRTEEGIVSGTNLYDIIMMSDLTACPSRDGYEFAGWYKDASCEDDYMISEDDVVTADITLYAKWEAVAGGDVINPSGAAF